MLLHNFHIHNFKCGFETGSISFAFKRNVGFGILPIKVFMIGLVHLFLFSSMIHGRPGFNFLTFLPETLGKQKHLSAHGNDQLIALTLVLEPF